MKPPLTVEARVAEELRNWLASELEQLDASNTNQFAHHVVTILLHEDLDIEDEPLTAGDDFLQNIYSIRRGKTRDRQKKAAVQFLRSAVCCNDSDESEIQGVVDELMVKIDETKSKMNRKSSKRSLLTPIAINVKTAQACNKSDGSEEERRYNEAFPSLASEESLSKESALRFNGDSIWNRSPPSGKENGRKKVKKKTSEYFSRHCYMFTCQEEAQACSIARQVAALALAETSLPNAEAAEVFPSTLQDSSPSSFADSSGCWKSAFRTVVLTKIFSPNVAPLQSKDKSTPLFDDSVLKVFSPNIVNGTDLSPPSLAISVEGLTFVEESHTGRLFHPIYDESNQHLFPKEMDYEEDATVDSKKADNEISTIFEASRQREERLRNKVQKTKKTKKITPFKQVTGEDDLENALQFPFHCGDFWHDIVEKGAIALYPDISLKEKLAREAVTRSVGPNIDTQVSFTPAAATTVSGDVSELSALCLVALRKNFALETMKSLVVHYMSSVMFKQGLTCSTGHILKGMVETLLKRKENTLLLVKCNTSEKRIQDNLDLDQVLEACIETLAKLLSPQAVDTGQPDQAIHFDQTFGAEQQAFEGSAHDYWQEEDSISFNIEINDLGEQNKLSSATLSCEAELVASSSFITPCSNIISGSTSCSIDLESIHMEDLVCFSEEGATPSISGFSPSFLDNIDLTYLDDFDKGEPRRTSVTFTEEAFIWNDSSEPSEMLDIWPLNTRSVKRQTFGHATQVTEWHISSGCYLTPLQPVETSGLDVYDQQDIGYFSNEMRQVQWDNPWSVTGWDSICKELLAGFMVSSTAWPKRASPPNPFKPSLFTSCLSKEGSQFLQSAFVNSYFSSISMEPSVNLRENTLAVDCSALEHLWLSKDRRRGYPEQFWLSQEGQHSFAFSWDSSSYELVRGVTCSNWLENNCTLGLLCPFSHPSI